jgi:hypothetical protein
LLHINCYFLKSLSQLRSRRVAYPCDAGLGSRLGSLGCGCLTLTTGQSLLGGLEGGVGGLLGGELSGILGTTVSNNLISQKRYMSDLVNTGMVCWFCIA